MGLGEKNIKQVVKIWLVWTTEQSIGEERRGERKGKEKMKD